MRIIGVTGGKGGTGKSTVAAALASALAKGHRVLLADADVDCPNAHILLGARRRLLRGVRQRIPEFDMDKCTACGRCAAACRTKAIISSRPVFIPEQCNGCGMCAQVCPAGAVSWGGREVGSLYEARAHGVDILGGEVNDKATELVVSALKEEVMSRDSYDLVIVDTAAGVHCPVISALELCQDVLTVTEPTPLGIHDLGLILELLQMLGISPRVLINRSDTADTGPVADVAERFGAEVALEIPYSDEILSRYSRGRPAEIPGLTEVVQVG